MNCLRRHSCWQKKGYWQGTPGGKQQDKGTQEKCFATWVSASGFMVMKLVSRLSLANHLACAHIWSDSGSFLVSCASLIQNGLLAWGFLGDWQDILWAGVSSLLLAPPEFSWLFLVLCYILVLCSTLFLLGTSCYETTHASCFSPCLARVGSFSQSFWDRKWAGTTFKRMT